jgi:hypothetical protein
MITQDQLARGVRPYGEFSDILTQISSLRTMGSKQRDDLLRGLYDLADRKLVAERLAATKRNEAFLLREQRRRISKVRASFCKAAQILEKACRSCEVEIEAKDALVSDSFEFGSQVRIAVATEKKNRSAAQKSRSAMECWVAYHSAPAYLLAQGGKISQCPRSDQDGH